MTLKLLWLESISHTTQFSLAHLPCSCSNIDVLEISAYYLEYRPRIREKSQVYSGGIIHGILETTI